MFDTSAFSAAMASAQAAAGGPPPASGPGPNSEQPMPRADPETGARILRSASGPAVLATLAGPQLKRLVPLESYKRYRDEVLADLDQKSDAIEQFLVEEILWAHQRLGQLHVDAASAKAPEMIEAFNTAAVRLMGEVRRTALALREYRSPIAPKVINVVKQQNLAAGDQQVAMVDNSPQSPVPGKNNSDTELASKQEVLEHDEPPGFDPAPDCGSTQPAKAARFNTRRPQTPAGSRQAEPALVTVNGSSVGCRQG